MSEDSALAWSGRYLEVWTRDGWEYAARPAKRQVVVVLAIDDAPDGRHVLLIEQHRPPIAARSLELPAGLVGDECPDEAMETAAARELEEETGWRAGRLERLGEFSSSPGLTAERFTLFRGTALSRVGSGGGVGEEAIAVHRVALDQVSAFVAARRQAGVVPDVRLLLLLGGLVVG